MFVYIFQIITSTFVFVAQIFVFLLQAHCKDLCIYFSIIEFFINLHYFFKEHLPYETLSKFYGALFLLRIRQELFNFY